MMNLFRSPYALIAVVLLAMSLVIGAYLKGEKAGSAGAALKLNAQTETAIGEISNEAERIRALRRYCIGSQRVWNFSRNLCQNP